MSIHIDCFRFGRRNCRIFPKNYYMAEYPVGRSEVNQGNQFLSRKSIHENSCSLSNQTRIQLESHTTQQLTSERPSLDIERQGLVSLLYNHQIQSISASTRHQNTGKRNIQSFDAFTVRLRLGRCFHGQAFFTCS